MNKPLTHNDYIYAVKEDDKIIRPTTIEDYELIKRLDTPLSLDEYRDKYGYEIEEVL